MIVYPTLAAEIAKREIKKKDIAQRLGLCEKSLRNRMTGQSEFTWPEARLLCRSFFPDMTPEELLCPAEKRS